MLKSITLNFYHIILYQDQNESYFHRQAEPTINNDMKVMNRIDNFSTSNNGGNCLGSERN